MATPHVSVPLPERSGSYVRVLYARVGFHVSFLSHSSKVFGVIMHWGPKHSFPCVREVMQCPWCKQPWKKLWYGWLYGIDQVKRGPALLQLTEGAVRSSAALSDSSVDLRGAKIELERISDSKGSNVQARTVLNGWDHRPKAEEPDVFLHLLRFYKIEVPQLGDDYQADEGQQ